MNESLSKCHLVMLELCLHLLFCIFMSLLHVTRLFSLNHKAAKY